MAYIGQFTSGGVLFASELNTPFAMTVLYSTAAQSIANTTLSTLQFSVAGDAIRDSLNWHNPAGTSARITVTIAGIYQVDGAVSYTGNAGTAAYLQLSKNGTGISRSSGDLSATGAASSLSTSTLINLAVGDYVDCAVYQNSGGALNTNIRSLSAVLLAV